MGIAYHKKTSTKYVQYTLRIEESILDKIKSIAGKEDLSINEVVNQSLQFAINDYEKNNNKGSFKFRFFAKINLKIIQNW